jgi:hypothetical protein
MCVFSLLLGRSVAGDPGSIPSHTTTFWDKGILFNPATKKSRRGSGSVIVFEMLILPFTKLYSKFGDPPYPPTLQHIWADKGG